MPLTRTRKHRKGKMTAKQKQIPTAWLKEQGEEEERNQREGGGEGGNQRKGGGEEEEEGGEEKKSTKQLLPNWELVGGDKKSKGPINITSKGTINITNMLAFEGENGIGVSLSGLTENEGQYVTKDV